MAKKGSFVILALLVVAVSACAPIPAPTLVASPAPTVTPAPTAAAIPATPSLPTAADANGLPPACRPVQGKFAAFGDEPRGFCFRYPENFQARIPEGWLNTVAWVVGPALDPSPDPLAATLVIEAVPSEGLDLKTAVAELLKEFEGQQGVAIRQRPFVLGGAPAALLEGVPGRGGSRDVVTVRNGYRLRLLFMPDPANFPQVKPDLDALFEAVTQSFTFMDAPETQGQSGQPGTMPRLPDRERAFAAARAALAAKLGVDEPAIQRVSVTAQEWSDACLGVSRANEMCAQVITPGWVVVMETGGKQYEAHTDQEGAVVRLTK